MEINFITLEDLFQFKKEFFKEFREEIKSLNSGPGSKWIRTKDVCKILKISISSVQNLRVAGLLPFSKIKGTLYYKIEDVEKLLDGSRITYIK